MRTFIQRKIQQIESWIVDPDWQQVASDCRGVLREVELKALSLGHPSIVQICQRRGGGLQHTRRLLAECMQELLGMQQPDDDCLLDLATTAELLGYKPAGLRKVVKAGQIRYVQNGNGPIKFRREWIDEYIKANNPSR